MTSKKKNQMRVNEIINTFKTMDYHFGKRNFRSGNIPFTMFGQFDQKQNILFHSKTDKLKTKYELRKVENFPRSIENYLEYLLNSNQQCFNKSSSFHNSNISVILIVLTFRVLFQF